METEKPVTPEIDTKNPSLPTEVVNKPVLSGEQETSNISTLPKTGIDNHYISGLGSGLAVLGWLLVRGIHKKETDNQ
ncbi:LPXTG cell wall anchor domain-containing protein [Erysipelothrix rhusiopathiae]|uniref:LPXTG cell wall anchor domain-containing protein n=1 Tax=Erysipelothrix rhusiopathiae TaxID=1648 RepID=UPI00295409C7|nr:LPXTG cell wall anchor domain-containing protein [Erysipelothrix rhusiopathiae]